MSAKQTATTLWSEVVRARDAQCRNCGAAGQRNHRGLPVKGLEAAHIIRRGYGHTRTDERNGVALCPLCHGMFTRNPHIWEAWVPTEVGADLLAELQAKAKRTDHVDWDAEVSRLSAIHTRLLAAA